MCVCRNFHRDHKHEPNRNWGGGAHPATRLGTFCQSVWVTRRLRCTQPLPRQGRESKDTAK